MAGNVTVTVPMVINRCFGGFGLSKEAAIEIAKRKGIEIKDYRAWPLEANTGRPIEEIVQRHDPVLIEVVRTMGDKTNGECAKLEVVEVVVDIEVDSFDGKETVNVFGGVAR